MQFQNKINSLVNRLQFPLKDWNFLILIAIGLFWIKQRRININIRGEKVIPNTSLGNQSISKILHTSEKQPTACFTLTIESGRFNLGEGAVNDNSNQPPNFNFAPATASSSSTTPVSNFGKLLSSTISTNPATGYLTSAFPPGRQPANGEVQRQLSVQQSHGNR